MASKNCCCDSKYFPRCRCDCNDIITFWDCLFGSDKWSDLHRTRGEVRRAARMKMCASTNVCSTGASKKDTCDQQSATNSNIKCKDKQMKKKKKTICKREVYSLEIEPSNFLQSFLGSDKDKLKNKEKMREEKKKVNKDDMKEQKKYGEQQMCKEETVGITNDCENKVNGFTRKCKETVCTSHDGDTRRRAHCTSTDKMGSSGEKASSIDCKSVSKTSIKRQLTALSTKIERLEDAINTINSCNPKPKTIPSCMNKQLGEGDKQTIIVNRCATEGEQRYKTGDNKRYTIERSTSNPSLLRIHAPKDADCSQSNRNGCVLIHTNKKDVCVHGRYLESKTETTTLWDRVKNIFNVYFVNQIFYNNKNKTDASCENKTEDSSTSDEDYISLDEPNLISSANSDNNLLIDKRKSYTILDRNLETKKEYQNRDKHESDQELFCRMLCQMNNLSTKKFPTSVNNKNEAMNTNFNNKNNGISPNNNTNQNNSGVSRLCHNLNSNLNVGKLYNAMNNNSDNISDNLNNDNLLMNNNTQQNGANISRLCDTRYLNSDMRRLSNDTTKNDLNLLSNHTNERANTDKIESGKTIENKNRNSEGKSKPWEGFTVENMLSTFEDESGSERAATMRYKRQMTKTVKSKYKYRNETENVSILKRFTSNKCSMYVPEKLRDIDPNLVPTLQKMRVYQVYESEDVLSSDLDEKRCK